MKINSMISTTDFQSKKVNSIKLILLKVNTINTSLKICKKKKTTILQYIFSF